VLSTDLPVTEHHAVGARRLSSHHGWWPSAAVYPRSVPPVWAVIGYGSPTELDVHNGSFCAAHLLRGPGGVRSGDERTPDWGDGRLVHSRPTLRTCVAVPAVSRGLPVDIDVPGDFGHGCYFRMGG
jgi:hypothetical protein